MPIKEDPRRRQKTVMCVDDDPAIREVIGHALGGAGYQSVICRSGPDCLARLSAVQPQLILLDLNMPGMDGFDTVREIRRRFPKLEVPLVMLTAQCTEKAVRAAKAVGTADYLIKPFRIAHLIERVDYWTGLRH